MATPDVEDRPPHAPGKESRSGGGYPGLAPHQRTRYGLVNVDEGNSAGARDDGGGQTEGACLLPNDSKRPEQFSADRRLGLTLSRRLMPIQVTTGHLKQHHFGA